MRKLLWAVAAFAIMALLAPLASAGAAPVGPSGGAAGKGWAYTKDKKQRYPGVHIDWDVPIRMSDGTVLKANVYRPGDAADRPVAVKTPTIVTMTPYTKLISTLAAETMQNPILEPIAKQIIGMINLTGTPIDGFGDLLKSMTGGTFRSFTVDKDLVRAGYSYVVVDVRGTGFSQGKWDVFKEREQRDTVEVIDWAAKQRFSNGKIGMTGMSYSAINQVYAANRNPAALKAIFPVVPGGDLVRDIVAPGGALGAGFLPMWLTLVNTTKMMPDLGAMFTGRFDWKWLADRLADPVTFFPQLFAALLTPDMRSIPPDMKRLLIPGTAERRGWMDHADRIQIPTMIVGGWFDLFTNSEVRMFNKIPLPLGQKQLVMGEAYHITPGAGHGERGTPPRIDVLQRAWFDKWLKGIDNGIDQYGPATLDQMGRGWITAPNFPRPGMTRQRLYLSDRPSGTAPHAVRDGRLSVGKPRSRGRLTVGPGVLTLCSRDAGQQTAGVTAIFRFCGRDNRIAEHNALTFTTAPVRTYRSISGYSNLRINAVSDATDGYWTAMLTDVAPNGESTVISSGQIVSSLRKIDPNQSQYAPNGDVVDPFYTMSLYDRKRVKPGVPVQLDLGLLPTEALLKPGHRLRVDVFAMNLPRGLPLRPLLNESGLRPQHIQLDPNRPSFLNVPVSKEFG
ncbi:MAG: CocE/NonD family hydrolase [Gordonia sp. (in: high G+C Gram-positive bacteria)]|uniref:CocE/NonD family hydrolase n=1 Tax=Gordonia sp. (in: high G+C Gram-positive bacteria) TaxID=84139 RepID=UPI0039E387DE